MTKKLPNITPWTIGSESITFDVDHSTGDSIELEFTIDQSNPQEACRFLLFKFGDNKTYLSSGSSINRTFTFNSDGVTEVKVIGQPSFAGVVEWYLPGIRDTGAVVKVDTLDLSSFVDLERFRFGDTSTIDSTDDGYLAADRMPPQALVEWITPQVQFAYDSALLGGSEITDVSSNSNVDPQKAKTPSKVVKMGRTSLEGGKKLKPGGLITPITEEILIERGGPDIDTSSSTGFGVDAIGDTGAVPNVIAFRKRNIGPDPVAPLLRAWRSLIDFSVKAPGDDFSEPNLFPDSIEYLGAFGMGLYMNDAIQPPAAEWRRMLNGLRELDLRIQDTFNYVNAEPQAMRFWDGFYQASVNNETRSDATIIVRNSSNKGVQWTGSKDDTYRIIGVGPYHPVNNTGSDPHNCLDAVGAVSSPNLMQRSYSRVSDTVLRISQGAVEGKSAAVIANSLFAYEPVSAGGDDVLWIYSNKESTGTFWKRGYAAGDLIRLVTSTEDEFVEVKDSTYDSSTNEVVVEIETGAGREPGAATVLPSGSGDSIYFHYVNSLDEST